MSWRPSRSWLRTKGWAGIVGVLVVVLALLVAVALPGGSLGPRAQGPGSVGPSGDPGSAGGKPGAPTEAPIPSPDQAAWTAVDVSTLPDVPTLEPTKAGVGGVALDTAFRLTSPDARPPATLAAALVAEPAISFAVASQDGPTAIVRPTAPLRPATAYRISLVRPDGSVEASWAAVAASPLAITDTVPGDTSTRVPRDTGIELTFNQYGVEPSDLARYFSIRPKVAGTFHAGGRTIAFAPNRPLAKGRLYTVTVRHGLPLAGTGQVLERDVVFRFETRTSSASPLVASFRHALIDGNRREATAITLAFENYGEGRAKRPSSVPVTIHRLPDMAAARTAYEAIRAAPSWTVASTVAPVSTAGLPREFKGGLRVRKGQEELTWILAPRLPNGWHLLTERWNGVPRQVVVQVTDLASFALVEKDRTAVWVNDLRTGKAVEGATAAIDGKRLGVTDGRGLLVGRTPAQVSDDARSEETPDAQSMVVIRHGGRSALLPVGTSWWCGWECANDGVSDEWWRTIATDRSEYRTTDTINAWGIVRNRDDGTVPASVTAVLLPESGSDTVAPIAQASASPDETGAFTLALPIENLPVAGYRVRVTAGEIELGDMWIAVRTLVKPAYRLDLDTDRHAAIVGESVTTSLAATFFEGTPVAGTTLNVMSEAEDEENPAPSTATTDASGMASATVRVPSPYGEEQWAVGGISARPTLPEEGEISGGTHLAVFRSSALVRTEARLDGTRLVVDGSVSDVAFDRYEAPGADLWAVDPYGAARPNPSVRITVVEETPVRRQVGTRYDFIQKRVVPQYEYDTRRKTVLKETVTGGADGTFRLTATVRGGSRSYDVSTAYIDEAGRTTTGTAYAATSDRPAEVQWMQMVGMDGPDAEQNGYAVGDPVRVRLTGGAGDVAGSRYLYAVSQRGLHYVTVGDSPTFRTTFKADDVPQVVISGVRFNGTGYEEVVHGYAARFRTADRRMTIELTPDRDRYAPSDTASVAIRTLDAAGQPVAATVVVRAIDEKLFAMGAADEADTLAILYQDVGSGIEGWASSHRTPFDDIPWGKGDTGGGDATGGRSEFRDWLVATLVHTDAQGRGSVQIPLSDDLTSWRLIASGLDATMDVGDGSVLLPVGLPFFVEATIAPEYLAADRPIIRVRGFGTGLDPAATVTFSVSSDTLQMPATTATATAFSAAELPLPPLSVGTHRVRIEGTTGTGTDVVTDVLTRTFKVVETRTTQARTTSRVLEGRTPVASGSGLTDLVLTDAGRGRVLPLLESLQGTPGPRLDDLLAASLAARVLEERFGLAPDAEADPGLLQAYVREDAGLALLPYSSWQAEVSALAAMTGDSRLDAQQLAGALWQVRDSPDESRARQLMALAGLAALDPSVLPQIRTAAGRGDLTVPEKISVSLAALNAGDETLARELEADVLRTAGHRYGEWVRVDAGVDADSALETARLAIVAASLGDPVAADMDRWLETHPSLLTSTNLERTLAARGWALRVPGTAAVAAITVDGAREEIRIGQGGAVEVPLTPAQAMDASIEPVDGTVLVVQRWESALDPASLAAGPGLGLERVVSPSGSIGSTDLVIVTLTVRLPSDPAASCWRVTDLVPSGLAPIRGGGQGYEEDGSPGAGPGSVDGQRVTFCAGIDPGRRQETLRYVARVITPGAYTWEPAVMQSTVAPDQGIVLAPRAVTIAGLQE